MARNCFLVVLCFLFRLPDWACSFCFGFSFKRRIGRLARVGRSQRARDKMTRYTKEEIVYTGPKSRNSVPTSRVKRWRAIGSLLSFLFPLVGFGSSK